MLNGLLTRQRRVHSQIEICRLLYTANFFAGCATRTLFCALGEHFLFHLYNWLPAPARSNTVSAPWPACPTTASPYKRAAVKWLQQTPMNNMPGFLLFFLLLRRETATREAPTPTQAQTQTRDATREAEVPADAALRLGIDDAKTIFGSARRQKGSGTLETKTNS